MQTILVTGAAGFIGSHLSEMLLSRGYKVTGVDNFDPFYSRKIKEGNLRTSTKHKHFEFYELDITKRESFESISENIDVVIHLAAKAGVVPSLKDPAGYIQTNITGTQNILECMRERGIRKYIFASSSSVYGNNKKIPFSEDDPVNEAISPYAYTKRACEIMNYSYHHLYDIDVVNLRFFTVFGPRQRPDLAIHKFVKLIDEGHPITMYGDGTSARDYTFIDDIIAGISAALKYVLQNEKVYKIFNLGNHSPVKLKELIEAIHELMNKPKNISALPARPGEVDITYADISKSMNELGYRPQTGLKEGLDRFIQWYYAQKS